MYLQCYNSDNKSWLSYAWKHISFFLKHKSMLEL